MTLHPIWYIVTVPISATLGVLTAAWLAGWF